MSNSSTAKEAKTAMFMESCPTHVSYLLAHVPNKSMFTLEHIDEAAFGRLRDYIGVDTECRSISILTASPNEQDDRWLTHLFMEALKIKFPHTALIVKALINNIKLKSSSRIPGKEGQVIMEAFLKDQFRESTGFTNISECGIFAFNFVLAQPSSDLDVVKSTANPGYIYDYEFFSKNGVALSGEALSAKVLAPYENANLEAICSVTGYVESAPTLKTEVVAGKTYNIPMPTDLNVNVLKSEKVSVSGRLSFGFEDGYTGLFMGTNHLMNKGGLFCWTNQDRCLKLDSLIGQTVQEAVNAINIQDRSKLRIGILTSSAKKKEEFETGLTKALGAGKFFQMIDSGFNKAIEIFVIKPKKMDEEQTLDSYAVVTGKYMSCRIDYKYTPVLMLLDAIFIEDTIFTICGISAPGCLYQPNSQQFISEMKRQNGENYDTAYTQDDYNVYNRVLLSQLNAFNEKNGNASMSNDNNDRRAFGQTLIASTVKTNYGTTITSIMRGFGDGYVPQEPSGANGFGWDTCLCITDFIMNDSNTSISLDDFYNYLAFDRRSSVEEMKQKYQIEGKTIADLDKDIVPLYKPRFFASIQFLSMIVNLSKNQAFNRELIIKYNSLQEKELKLQTSKRLALAVNIANQMSKGTIGVEKGMLVQKKKINAMDLF